MGECTCSINYEAECNRLRDMIDKEICHTKELEAANRFLKEEVEQLKKDNQTFEDSMAKFNYMHGQVEAYKFCIEHFNKQN